MSTVKRAVSLDQRLDERAESAARSMRVSRSRFHAIALDEYMRRLETKRMMEQMNAACAEGMDEDDRKFLEAASWNMGQILQREDQAE